MTIIRVCCTLYLCTGNLITTYNFQNQTFAIHVIHSKDSYITSFPRIRSDLHDKLVPPSTDEFKGSTSWEKAVEKSWYDLAWSQMEDETWESISVPRTSCNIASSWRDISKLLQNSVDPLDLPPLLCHLSTGKIKSKQRWDLLSLKKLHEVMGHKDGSHVLTRNWENPILKGAAFDFDKWPLMAMMASASQTSQRSTYHDRECIYIYKHAQHTIAYSHFRTLC